MVHFDFNSIQQRIISNLQATVSFAQILPNSTNLRLIDAFAEELANLAQYDEYLTNETKWSLARNSSSLLSAEAIHGYAAHRKVGATGNIRVGLSALINSATWSSTLTYASGITVYYNNILYTSSQAVPINKEPDLFPLYWTLVNISPTLNVGIPIWTVFTDTTGNIKFTSYNAQTLAVGQNFIDVPVVQGTPKSFTVTAQGLNNEEFLLSDATVENNIFQLYVNNILWSSVSNLLDQNSTATTYQIENVLDFSGIYLKFGDNTNGKKLSNGDVVKFNYVSTNGSINNITSTNIIIKISSTLYDTGNNAVTAFCTNQSSLLGGQDYEDIESIRLNAPKIFQTGERASSASDYQAIILNNFSFVSKVNVWGSYEFNIDNGLDPWTFIPAEENVVNVAIVTTGGTNISAAEQLSISQGINQFKAPTDIVVYNTVRFLNLVFRTTAYVSDTTFTLSQVVSNITNLLTADYSVLALQLHQNIYFSDYQTLIDGAAGVDHHSTYAEIYYDFTFSSAYVSSLVLPSVNLRPLSMRIYVSDTINSPTVFSQVAKDDGAGNLTAVGSYTLTNSTINYNTGQGTLQVATGLTQPFGNYKIRVYYRLSSDDLLLVNRNDIFSFDPTNSSISSSYIRQ